MGVNVLLFLVFQIGVEPWRRKRLVKGFEEKVVEALEKEKDGYAPVRLAGEAIPHGDIAVSMGDGLLAEAPSADQNGITESQTNSFPAIEEIEGEKSWQRFLRICQIKLWDLFSERMVNVRQLDLTARAIEGTLAGIAICNFGWRADSQHMNLYSLMAGLFLLWVRITLQQ